MEAWPEKKMVFQKQHKTRMQSTNHQSSLLNKDSNSYLTLFVIAYIWII